MIVETLTKVQPVVSYPLHTKIQICEAQFYKHADLVLLSAFKVHNCLIQISELHTFHFPQTQNSKLFPPHLSLETQRICMGEIILMRRNNKYTKENVNTSSV